MDMKSAFPSNYLKADDLQEQFVPVKIARVVQEELGTDQKPVMYFEGKTKGLVLNRTNTATIAADFGWDSDAWAGKTIELFEMKVPFQGGMVPAIRIRMPRQTPGKVTIAPNARDRAMGQQQRTDWQAPKPTSNDGPAPWEDDPDADQSVPF